MYTHNGYSEEVLRKIEFRKNSEGTWRIYIDDIETPIQGAGGVVQAGMLEIFQSMGGNFTRTWGINTLESKVSDGKRYIDLAHELGVNVMAGMWLGHERHGFSYTDEAQLQKQRDDVRAAVRKWKDHPGVVIWGLGNEMEDPASPTGKTEIWKELEVLAKIIKEEDPTRPIMTVIAGSSPAKTKALIEHCPTIDALGVNAYGSAGGVGSALKSAGWTKPFAVTEFGVKGFWEVPTTSWGAPIEPNSTEKARMYYGAHQMVTAVNDGKELCLGTFAFLWGWKQEKTATWFGMYLPTMERLPQVDAMVKAWTGKFPENRAPRINSVESELQGAVVPPNRLYTAYVDVDEKDGDPMTFEWVVVDETKAISMGGDHEYTPDSHKELTKLEEGQSCAILTPSKAGEYRLFLTIRDDKGTAATANIPFKVQ